MDELISSIPAPLFSPVGASACLNSALPMLDWELYVKRDCVLKQAPTLQGRLGCKTPPPSATPVSNVQFGWRCLFHPCGSADISCIVSVCVCDVFLCPSSCTLSLLKILGQKGASYLCRIFITCRLSHYTMSKLLLLSQPVQLICMHIPRMPSHSSFGANSTIHLCSGRAFPKDPGKLQLKCHCAFSFYKDVREEQRRGGLGTQGHGA